MKIELEVIPCHERMPVSFKPVIAYWDDGSWVEAHLNAYDVWVNRTNNPLVVPGIVAWSPLPHLTLDQLVAIRKPKPVTEIIPGAETLKIGRRDYIAQSKYDEALSLLRELEWSGRDVVGTDFGDEIYDVCPICGNMDMDKHTPNCRLKKIIGVEK